MVKSVDKCTDVKRVTIFLRTLVFTNKLVYDYNLSFVSSECIHGSIKLQFDLCYHLPLTQLQNNNNANARTLHTQPFFFKATTSLIYNSQSIDTGKSLYIDRLNYVTNGLYHSHNPRIIIYAIYRLAMKLKP